MYKLSGFPYEPTNEWFAADQNNLLSGMYNILYDVDMVPVSGSEASIDTTNDIHQLSVAIATEASRGTFYKCTEDGLNNSYTLSVSPSGNHALQTKPKNGNRYSFIVPSENSGPTVMNIPFHVSTGGGGEHMMSNIDIIQSNGLPLVGGEFIEGMFIQLLFHYSDGGVPQLKIISSGTGGAGEITKNISQSNNFKLNQALYIDKTGKYQVANAGSPDGTLSGAGFKSGVVGIVSKEGIQSFELTMMGSMSVNDGFVKGSDYWLNPNTSLTPTDPNIVPIEPIWDEFPYSVRVYIGTALSKDELLVNVDVGSELYEELTYTMAKEGIAFWNKNLGYRINYRCIDTLDNNEYYATVSINPGGDTPSKNKDWKEVYSDKNIIKVNQTNHGFVKWDILRFDGTTPPGQFVKALSDEPIHAAAYGVVDKYTDNTFDLVLNGNIFDINVELAEDTDYYLSNETEGELIKGGDLKLEYEQVLQYIGTTSKIGPTSADSNDNAQVLNVQIAEGVQPIEFPPSVIALNGLDGHVGITNGPGIDVGMQGSNIIISNDSKIDGMPFDINGNMTMSSNTYVQKNTSNVQKNASDIVNLKLQNDTIIHLLSTNSQAVNQAIIDAVPKNLGGYDLTIQFADGTYTNQALKIQWFYNGALYIYGNASDNTKSASKSVVISHNANTEQILEVSYNILTRFHIQYLEIETVYTTGGIYSTPLYLAYNIAPSTLLWYCALHGNKNTPATWSEYSCPLQDNYSYFTCANSGLVNVTYNSVVYIAGGQWLSSEGKGIPTFDKTTASLKYHAYSNASARFINESTSTYTVRHNAGGQYILNTGVTGGTTDYYLEYGSYNAQGVWIPDESKKPELIKACEKHIIEKTEEAIKADDWTGDWYENTEVTQGVFTERIQEDRYTKIKYARSQMMEYPNKTMEELINILTS